MNFCIDANQLRAALNKIEKAEANGFNHCLAVFKITQAGRMIDENRAEYSDLLERAHPTDENLNWGRFQGVSERNKFVAGHIVPLTD